jgi:hypothetical protein
MKAGEKVFGKVNFNRRDAEALSDGSFLTNKVPGIGLIFTGRLKLKTLVSKQFHELKQKYHRTLSKSAERSQK